MFSTIAVLVIGFLCFVFGWYSRWILTITKNLPWWISWYFCLRDKGFGHDYVRQRFDVLLGFLDKAYGEKSTGKLPTSFPPSEAEAWDLVDTKSLSEVVAVGDGYKIVNLYFVKLEEKTGKIIIKDNKNSPAFR